MQGNEWKGEWGLPVRGAQLVDDRPSMLRRVIVEWQRRLPIAQRGCGGVRMVARLELLFIDAVIFEQSKTA